MKSDKKMTTLSVSEAVANVARREAIKHVLPLHKYVALALTFFKQHGEIHVVTSKRKID